MKFIYILFLLTYSYISFSQTTFDLLINTNNDEELNNVLEMDDGNLILSGAFGETNFNTIMEKGYVVTISPDGEILNELIIEKSDTCLDIQKIIKFDDGYIVISIAGDKQFGFANTINYQKYDSNFNLLKDKYYTISTEPIDIVYLKTYINSAGNIILSSELVEDPNDNWDFEIFYMEISPEGDSIQTKIFYNDNDIRNMTVTGGVIEKKDLSGYYSVVMNYPDTIHIGLPGKILNLSNNFEVLSYENIPDNIAYGGDIKRFTDISYIVTGRQHISFDKDNLGAVILDTANTTININSFGETGFYDIPAPYNSIEFDNEFIYLAGTNRYSLWGGAFGENASYIYFVKTNRQLEPVFEKFYKGDAYYYVNSFKKTNDNGFIFLTTRYDHTIQDNERDIYILKVDSEGNLPVSVEDLKIKAHELIIYPNPSKLYLNIRTAVQCIGGKFNMYDISGKQVFEKDIIQSITQIDIEYLPAGTYIYNYVYKGKEIESGKWIKNAL